MSLLLSTIAPISAIFAFRMLGLFMLIPVFTLYASHLSGATPVLMGLALGGYGLSQGLMQIPFGLLSDRYGRKPIITLGLILFAVGTAIGATTHSMTGMIVARIIQGLGAIGSVLIALLADLTPEKQRTFSMAILGASIGLSFGIAFTLSPLIAQYSGLPGIFYFTLGLIGIALLLLHAVIPTPDASNLALSSQTTSWSRLRTVLRRRALQRLNFGIFCQHFIFTSVFFFIPLRIEAGIRAQHLSAAWHLYVPLLMVSFLMMAVVLYCTEKYNKTRYVFILAVLISLLSQFGFLWQHLEWPAFVGWLFVYFVAFNVLETMLPTLISKTADPSNKGAAMGVYSTSQFLGIFAGGSLAGLLYQHYGISGIVIINACVATLWLYTAFSMPDAPQKE